MTKKRPIRRRTVLRGTAVGTAAALGVTGVTAQTETEIELEGHTNGWVGRAPEAIEDEQNPTLELVAGETYTLTWENSDGVGHNFVVEDEDGDEQFVETEILSGTGETQEIEFTAEEGMAEYFCAPHPQTMRGDIELVDDEDDAADDVEAAGAIFEDGPTIGLETVADGLTAPVDFQVADEGADRRFIVDQTGQIYVHGEDGLADDPFLDVTDEMVELEGDFDERGLLGLAFHPEFADNGEFFVRYSADGEEPEYGAPGAAVPETVDHLDRLSRFETSDDDNEAVDVDSEEILLEIPQPQFNHNAGPIAFGPDDYLYVATGDGGGAGDSEEGHVDDWYPENEGGNGQDTEHNLLGGILRIDVDEGADAPDDQDEDAETDESDEERAYGIPDDNPLVDADDQLDEYWSWGHRNPWGMSFENGELLAADVGQALFEIINHVEEGGNYAWNVWEGTHGFDPDAPEDPPEDRPDSVDDDVPGPRGGEPLLGPVIEYPQEADLGRYADEYDEAGTIGDDRDRIGTAIIGGRMYESDQIDDLEDGYVFGDWSWNGQGGGRLFVARPPEGWPEETDDTGDDIDEDVDGDEDDVERGADDEAVDPDDPDENDTADGLEDDDTADVDDDDDPNGLDENDTEDDLEQYHPPDEVDLWSIEELTIEADDEMAEEGLLNHLVYAFGRDADGEVYVLTSDTPTIEGEGYVSRIVPADEVDDAVDQDDDAVDENETPDEDEAADENETPDEDEAADENETSDEDVDRGADDDDGEMDDTDEN